MNVRRNRDAAQSASRSSSGRDTPLDIEKFEVVLSSPSGSASRTGSTAESRELQVPNPKDDGSRWEWLLDFGRNVGTGRVTDAIAGNREEDGIKSVSSVAEMDRSKVDLHAMADISGLELQTLRKQIVKETKRSRNLSRQLERLSKEKDALEKEIERMKDTRMLSREGKDPERVIEELQQELYHEKDVSSRLRLQLSKTRESNEELLLAVKDLDDMLKRKDEEKSRKVGPPRDEEGDIYSQMEQLALDYEILQQENHELSCRLEQSRLQEQLKMHFDCFSCGPVVYEVENQIETLEKELEKKSKELRDIASAKNEQEKRAERAENEMRKTRSKYATVATKLQEEFRVLTEQMVLTFKANEITATKAMTEASRMHSEKNRLEEMLEKANMEVSSIRDSYEMKLRENTDQIGRMKSEIDEKSAQVEDKNWDIVKMKSEITRLARENGKCERKEPVSAIKVLENKIERLEEKISSLRSMNDEKDLTIGNLRSQVHSVRAKGGETTISAQEHGMDKERPRKRAAKLKEVVKEISPSIRMAEKKTGSNQITALDRRKTTHRHNEAAKKERTVATSSSSYNTEWAAAESSTSGARESRLDEATHESANATEKNRSLEHELRGLQERYSEISLMLAEVEGERQQLAMTARCLAQEKQ
ncbi:hypothetical protein MLD38_018453 [Melastoma candidum]|uniref:Uncharacterized protein n=1 Tax=Melastoma candidum TaxID=119954 RepID=A0ACB9QXX5_9MYRT|nr:hypothetical protein MLD38_018453 [Melastoma candidum]